MGEPRAVEVATRETLAFVRSALPPGATRVLEVGCGGGELAAELARGLTVVAVDESPEAIERTRALGVDARLACFPEFDPGPDEELFDAVLFTRSLHHVEPLEDAYERTVALLRPGGRLVVEDWAWEEADRATAEWAFGQARLLESLGLLPADEEEWRRPGDPLVLWHAAREEHHIHRADALLAAAAERFELERVERAPYVYRFPCRFLEGCPGARAATEQVLATERALAEAGAILLLGLRIVAAPRT